MVRWKIPFEEGFSATRHIQCGSALRAIRLFISRLQLVHVLVKSRWAHFGWDQLGAGGQLMPSRFSSNMQVKAYFTPKM